MSVKSLFDAALLSEAAYADFWDETTNQVIVDDTRVKTALQNIGGEGEGFSATQAEEFTKHWRIVDHQPNTANGFSATVGERSRFAPFFFTLSHLRVWASN